LEGEAGDSDGTPGDIASVCEASGRGSVLADAGVSVLLGELLPSLEQAAKPPPKTTAPAEIAKSPRQPPKGFLVCEVCVSTRVGSEIGGNGDTTDTLVSV